MANLDLDHQDVVREIGLLGWPAARLGKFYGKVSSEQGSE